MKKWIILFGLMFSLVLIFNYVGAEDDFPVLKGPYLGQKPPGMTPEIFAPGIVSTAKKELNSVFSTDGKEFFFVRIEEDVYIIYYSKQINGQWTKPEKVPFSGDAYYVDINFSPDGHRLYFCSNRPSRSSIGKMDIWYCERKGKAWSEPRNIGLPVNSTKNDVYPVFTRNKGLYFASDRKDEKGDWDVYYTHFINGRYSEPVSLGVSINSQFGEGDTYVDFDESFMIVTSWGRPNSYGNSDLYISFRLKDGSWSKAKNMGNRINTEFSEHCPILTLDKKYLFFTSTRTGNRDIYWVDAKIIEDLKPDEIK